MTKKDKENKGISKYIDSPLIRLLRINYGHAPWLLTKEEMTATLIPRHITHIKVFGFQTDVRMVSQRQQARPPQPQQRTSDAATSNHRDIRAIDTSLHQAANTGSIGGVREAVEKNKEHLWCKNAQGNLPLHLAVENGHTDVASYLVKEYPQGSYAVNRANISPLYLAVVGRHTELVDSMLKALVMVNPTELVPKLMRGKSILHAAIATQNEEMVRLLLKNQPELMKSKDEEGRTPLSYAAHKGFADITRYILKRYRDSATTQDSDHSYPIQKACLGGHVEVLQIFHTYSPNSLLLKDNRGRNILHLAAKEPSNKLKRVVSYLLSLNDISKELVNKKDENRYTPLALAERSKNVEVVQLINQYVHP